jgi:hypothetical protein
VTQPAFTDSSWPCPTNNGPWPTTASCSRLMQAATVLHFPHNKVKPRNLALLFSFPRCSYISYHTSYMMSIYECLCCAFATGLLIFIYLSLTIDMCRVVGCRVVGVVVLFGLFVCRV